MILPVVVWSVSAVVAVSGMTMTAGRTSREFDYDDATTDIVDEISGIELHDGKWLSTTAEIRKKHTTGTNEIRCYCNLPECVDKNYMCKSNVLACFSDLHDSPNSDKTTHGCLDLLPRDKKAMCQNRPGGHGLGSEHSLLLCCHEDLCNPFESVNRILENDTMRKLEEDDDSLRSQPMPPNYSSQEVWFKAATIAVPICGLLILLVLIVLAVKILKTDPQALPPKMWAKDVSAGLLVGGRGVAVGDVHNAAVNGTADLSSCCGGSNKLPLLFKPNDCSSAGAINQRGRLLLVPTGAAPEKNETQAKLNNNYSDNCSPTRDPARTPPPPYDVIGLHKATTNLREAACNLYQPLLDHPPPTSPQAPQNLGLLHCSNVFEDSESWRPLAKRP